VKGGGGGEGGGAFFDECVVRGIFHRDAFVCLIAHGRVYAIHCRLHVAQA
jgi:hypothetical protein